MQVLYPDIKPFNEQFIDCGQHQIFVEQSGNPDGIAVLIVHGGPGAGCGAKQRCFFDPEHYHIILFDQRGCGQSRPHASLHENQPHYLLQDMECIRQSLALKNGCCLVAVGAVR